MTAIEPLTHTESKSGLKHIVKLTLKFRVEKFPTLMKSYEPGERGGRLESEGVSSELAPSAVWKLQVYPNGCFDRNEGNVSVVLCHSRPMMDAKETLDATCHIYLVDESGRKIDVLERTTNKFKWMDCAWGEDVDHERVKKALQADNSLLLVADIKFPPSDACKGCALRGDETQQRSGANSFEIRCDKYSSDYSSGDSSSDYSSVNSSVSRSDKASSYYYSVNSYEIRSDKPSSDYSSVEIEKCSIEKVLRKGNVIAMAARAQNHLSFSTDRSAKLLTQACLELIAREWDAVYESAEWRGLEEDAPKLAVDLAFGAATHAETRHNERFKEACIKLITTQGTSVYESAAWTELEEAKPRLALDLAMGVSATVLAKEKP